mgnify:CR=1 FL=1
MAPATVLLLMTLLLGFLQYTYWDLSVKRQQAHTLGTVFVTLAEADLAARRIYDLSQRLTRGPMVDAGELHAMEELYRHLDMAVSKVTEMMPPPEETLAQLHQAVADLDPEGGFDPERFLAALAHLRPQLKVLSELSQKQRQSLREVHSRDIDELVARTTLVSLVVLGAAILLGIFLSLAFARRILSRIQTLSDSAGRIARGELVPPPAPEQVRDELDDLALSINRMTERLIRVVGAEKLLEGAEEERRRIAMDIHDQTLSDLSSVLRGLQGMKETEGCSGQAAGLEEDLQRAIANLREVMDNLHPQTLEILGLGAALQSHMERHLAKGGCPEYHLHISPGAEAEPLNRLVSLTLYRIAVEAVHNVIKHARAERYEVNLDRRNGEMVLSVEDNGTGFDAGQVGARGGRGLNNIRERAGAIGARVSWGASRFSTGTRFELTLPVGQAKNEG